MIAVITNGLRIRFKPTHHPEMGWLEVYSPDEGTHRIEVERLARPYQGASIRVKDSVHIVCAEKAMRWPFYQHESVTLTDTKTQAAVEVTWDEEGILFRYLQVQK